MKKNHLIVPWNGTLRKATLVGRPHRFRVDVRFGNNVKAGAHCVNPGRGEGLLRRGSTIWVSPADSKERALRWTWMLTRRHRTFVGTNSLTANDLVHQLLVQRLILGFRTNRRISREVSSVPGVRLDFAVRLSRFRNHYF